MTNFKMELVKVPYDRLLKLELRSYAKCIINIVDQHEPEVLKIDGMFDLLVAKTPQIEQLNEQYRAHPLTKILKELRRMRKVYIDAIVSRLKVVMGENKPELKYEVNLARIEINRFLENLSLCRTEVQRNEKVALFFRTVEENEELEEAFSTLGFTTDMNDLRSVHSRIITTTAARIKTSSQRPGEKTKDLRSSVIQTLRYFFKELEIAPMKNSDLDYKSLYSELNELSTEYKNMINVRLANNKRKAERRGEVDIDETDETEVSTEATSSSHNSQPLVQRMFHLNTEELDKNVNGNGNGSAAEPLKQEKAVATSAKHEQLPSVNNED